jgi:cyclophilin family peptidyl-prolyl cis-trans isomerase
LGFDGKIKICAFVPLSRTRVKDIDLSEILRFNVIFRSLFGLGLVLVLVSVAGALTVRFKTTAGDFDVVLNPTNNASLKGHVDNFINYVMSGRYDNTVINRADENFVLQMGAFKTATPQVPATVSGFTPIQKFPTITGVPAASIPLSHTPGTVSLALSGGAGGTDRNSGSNSFFINLAHNTFLDNDFTVFASVPNMTTVNTIMGLSQVDLTADPNFGVSPGNLAFSDVPLHANGNLVQITRAILIPNIVGDFNMFNSVDTADYIMWRSSLATNPPGLVADADLDGIVDHDDYQVWRHHMGAFPVLSAPAAGSGLGSGFSVPEPDTLFLLACLAAGFARLAARRR